MTDTPLPATPRPRYVTLGEAGPSFLRRNPDYQGEDIIEGEDIEVDAKETPPLPATPAILRLTGEQIGSIDPPVPGDWFVDFDEYEEFVTKREYDAATARVDGLRRAMRMLIEAIEDGQRTEMRPTSGAEYSLTQTFGNRYVASLRRLLEDTR